MKYRVVNHYSVFIFYSVPTFLETGLQYRSLLIWLEVNFSATASHVMYVIPKILQILDLPISDFVLTLDMFFLNSDPMINVFCRYCFYNLWTFHYCFMLMVWNYSHNMRKRSCDWNRLILHSCTMPQLEVTLDKCHWKVTKCKFDWVARF